MPRLATIAAFGFPDIPTATMLRLMKQIGCQTCQFYRNEKAPPDVAEARRLAEDAGLPIDSVHGVFGPTYDPSSPDESVRSASVAVYQHEAELALQLGGPRVVVHPAPHATPEQPLTPAIHQPRRDAMARSLDELAVIGQSLGVTFLIENLPTEYLFGSNPLDVAELVRDRQTPSLRMCFDTGHAHMTSDILASFTACRDVISYLHVHDNRGDQDAHLLPGEGTIPWDKLNPLLATMPAALPAMLELFQDQATFRAAIQGGLSHRLTRWLLVG